MLFLFDKTIPVRCKNGKLAVNHQVNDCNGHIRKSFIKVPGLINIPDAKTLDEQSDCFEFDEVQNFPEVTVRVDLQFRHE